MNRLSLAACILTLALCTPLQAEMVQIDFLGNVNNVVSPPGFPVHHSYGDPIIGNLFFDSEKIASSTDESAGVKNYTFAKGEGGIVLWVNGDSFIVNGLSGTVQADLDEAGKRSVAFTGVADDGVSIIGITFGEPAGPHILTADLPTTADLLALGQAHLGGLLFKLDVQGGPLGASVINGDIHTIMEVPVVMPGGEGPTSPPEATETPEPASALLAVCGLAGILTRRLARRNR